MKFRAIDACDFSHFNTSGQQRIRDQGTMTAPGHGFRAHNRRLLPPRKFYEIGQILPELGCLHIVGEAAEAGVTPGGIDGIPPRMPESTQSRHIPVMKPDGMQCRRQCSAVELRIVSRTRDRAYIDQPFHTVRFEKTNELLYRTGGVTDRHHDQRYR
jgi:hypothetical protein